MTKDEEQRHLALVELNVIEQCLNLYKTGVVQRARFKAWEGLKAQNPSAKVVTDDIFPRIHGFVFNPSEGVLKKLPIDFAKRVGSLDHIYGLISKD
jgi:carbonic anhydrase